MTVITNIAEQILAENGYTTDDCSVTNLEYLINLATDHINLVAGTSIADISSNDLTATDAELAATRLLSGLLLRAYLEKGPNVGVGALNVAQVTADPHYKVFMKLFNQSLNYLRTRSFERV